MKNFRFIIYCWLLFNIALFAQKTTFVHISDTHIGAQKADSLLELTVKKVNSLKNIDFVVITGDVTELGSKDEIDKAKKIISKIKYPCYVLAGNHDSRYVYDDLYYFNKNFQTRFAFNKNGYDFIGINTAVSGKGVKGLVNDVEIRWLKRQLTNKKSNQTIVFTHHPPNDIQNFDRFIKETKLKISAVFAGHQHKNIFSELGGVKYFVVNANKYQDGGFNIVSLDKDSINVYHYSHSNQISELFSTKLTPVDYKGKSSEISSVNSAFDIQLKEFGKKALFNSPAVFEDKMYFGYYDGSIKCQKLSGEILWQNKVQGNIFHSPVVIDSLLIVATVQGDIATFDLLTGNQIQTIGTGYTLSSPLFEMDYKGNKTLFLKKYPNRTPSVGVFTADGQLLIYEIYMLQPLQQVKFAENAIENLPIIENNKIYFTSKDGFIYCADPFNGVIFWKYFFDNSIYNNVAYSLLNINDKNLFFTSTNGSVLSLNKDLGKINWKADFDASGYVLFVASDTIFVIGKNNYFYKINAKNGKLITKFEISFIENYNSNPMAKYNNGVVFQLSNGEVYRYLNGNITNIAVLPDILPNKIQAYKNALIFTNIAGDVFVISQK